MNLIPKSVADLADSAQKLLTNFLGPASEETGLLLADHVRVIRLKNQFRVLEKAQEMLRKAKVKPKAVNMKLMVPLMEGCQLEEDESMAERWAALLANAVSDSGNNLKRSLFPQLLKEISPTEAIILEWLDKKCPRRMGPYRDAVPFNLSYLGLLHGSIDENEFWTSCDNLK